MAIQLSFGEIPKDVKDKIEEDWEKGRIKELMKELRDGLKKMDRGKLEKLLKGKSVSLESSETNNQKPETYTKNYIIEPLLKYLGYSPDKEELKKRASGKRRYPDYKATDSYGNVVLIEAEPINVDLREKYKGINQVDDWMDFKTRIGFATNGLRWILHYYKDTADIEEIIDVDLTPFFQKIWFNGFVDDEQIKDILQQLYYYFSKRWIKIAIDETITSISLRREEITKRFYKDFIKIVFGMEEKGSGKSVKIEKVGKGLVDYVKAPAGTKKKTKRKFAILFMNRLIFIAFLENINLIPPRSLEKLYQKWNNSGSPHPFYDEYLKPLFYEVLNTEPDNREEHVKRVEIFNEIPYLNGGLFRENIPNEREKFSISDDKAIWKAIKLLEESELTIKGNGGKTLNPDVLGYIYEKVINLLTSDEEDDEEGDKKKIKGGKKGLGAYYTPDEITSYIARNTIEPVVVERIKKVLNRYNEEGANFVINFNTLDEVLDEEKPITRDARVWKDILEEINAIRVLDPAVGSGHFLISALKILTDIKKRIYNIMKEEIDMYKIKLDIILKNLYGVDIDGSAVEITKLRLWLALIENIDVEAVKKGDVVLPNVEYNVREGNSLVGWVNEDLEVTINFAYTKDMEKLFKELKTYAGKPKKEIWKEKISKAEELLKSEQGNTLKNYIEAYHLIYEIYRESVGEVASDLKGILEDIRESIYPDINGAYADYLLRKSKKRISNKKKKEFTDKLIERKPFHWKVDFGWIMDAGGFDVVIGNPPHGNLLSNIEKEIVNSFYKFSNPQNIAEVFIERSNILLNGDRFLGLVIPKPISFYVSWEKSRKLLLNYHQLIHLYDLGIAFVGVNAEQIGFVSCKRHPKPEQKVSLFIGEPLKTASKGKKIIKTGEIPHKILQDVNIFILRPFNRVDTDIINWIRNKGIGFSNMYGTSDNVFRGVYIPDKYKKIYVGNKGVPWIDKVPHVKRYYLDKIKKLDIAQIETDINKINKQLKKMGNSEKEKIKILKKKLNDLKGISDGLNKVAKPRLFFKVLRGNRIIVFADLQGIFVTTEKLVNVVLSSPSPFSLKNLTLILNSKVPSFYIEKVLFSEDTETSRVLDEPYLRYVILPQVKNTKNISNFDVFYDYMIFLNSTEELRNHYTKEIKFFDILIDFVVYELYFKEKFHEDKLYPGPKEYLLEKVSKHLKPINYDRWAELYWKKRIDGKLTKTEERELKKLEKENTKIVEEVYNSLKNDEEIQELIEKIKSHEWVNNIERWHK